MFNKGPIKMSRSVRAINELSTLQRFANNAYENYDLDTNNFAYNESMQKALMKLFKSLWSNVEY